MFSVNRSVCLVCCVFDSVCELFHQTILIIFGFACYFVVECNGSVECGWRCSTRNVHVVPVIPVCI